MTVAEGDSTEKAGPSRPPARGGTGPSRHHLEPNPFEQSFSSKPSNQRSESPEGANKASKNAKKLGHKATKSETGIKHESSAEEQTAGSKASNGSDSGKGNASSTTASQTPSKRILPPVSSIASPAAQETTSMHYPWSSSLTGSLRSGPLSPAMLAGPQSTFDVSNFRSGFTPDLSNFKTGLTPLGATSSSFPPPSPNTAAFLAMVTNGSAPGLSGATITPNTLSALSGNPMDAHANTHAMVSSQPGQNGDTKGAPAPHHGSEQHDQFDFAFGRSMQDTPTKQSLGNSKLRNSTSAAVRGQEFNDHASSGSKANSDQQQQAPGQQKDTGNQMTSQAASGLFLLSQAHQELSKREDAAAAAAAAAATSGQDGGLQGLNGHNLYNNSNAMNASAKPNKAGKRKKSVEPAGPTAKPGSGKKVKANSMAKLDDSMGGPDEEDYESDELDDEGNRRQKSSNGDGGDDEEKRKNFLERNRQAALKCRQRKKAWLASLQAKVEYLQSDNENLQGTVSALRNEVMFLKSQLMQAQRPYSGGPPTGLPTNAMDGGPGSQPALGRNSVSGPVPMQGNAMSMSHNMPSQSPQHQQNNINAMAVAAAAAAANQSNASHRGGPNAASGQYQAHAVPRPTHIPGQPNAPPSQQQYHQPHQKHARQSSAQAA